LGETPYRKINTKLFESFELFLNWSDWSAFFTSVFEGPHLNTFCVTLKKDADFA